MKIILNVRMTQCMILYLIQNIITFFAYGIDKKRAIEGKWRISENKLILLAFFGGGPGAFIGMHFFRHKTRHFKFLILIPLFVIMQFALIGLFYYIYR